ncbi:Protein STRICTOSIDINE SYNTHASE-LIKE 3 [Capsicum baccatum]|uniref:Protein STRICTOSIDINE SYNTHASE-LIKE 3 n=1 Tax=Capsicum baccatum TaxID=33114 RepID=A0A2G2WMI6_CAPBA|nr:Protein STRICTOSIDINE SYNTHASE-LIKE 3 [Capsicum baccatum]
MSPGGVFTGVFFLLAVYCGVDPFKHSAIYDVKDFKAYRVDVPHWSEIPVEKDTQNLLQKSEIKFLNEIQGPESIAFDPKGRGPYTGIADGRIVLWDGEKWIDFAYTSANNRSGFCDPKPSPLSYLKNEHICGRPLGLQFDKRTGDLYFADAYFGLMKVGPEGGLAETLTTEAEGVPLVFTNDLDVDDEGNVYFTDSSTKYQRRNFMLLVYSAEDSGRVLKYNPSTKQTTVLVRNLQFPNGLSLSKDRSFFVFCEGAKGRLQKYWLKGEKAGTLEVMAVLPGYPDNISTNERGEFWVAIHSRRTTYSIINSKYPQLRLFLLKLPIPVKLRSLLHGSKAPAIVVKYSPEGKLLQILEDGEGKVVSAVSDVEEIHGKLWMGSVLMPIIAVYQLE